MRTRQLQVVFSRPVDAWSGQGQSLKAFLSLVVPKLSYKVRVVSEPRPGNAAMLFWDMQDYCRMVERASAVSIVRIGGMQPPDLWPGKPLPERLEPLQHAPVIVSSGYTLAGELRKILEREVVPIPHCLDLEMFRPSNERGHDIVAVCNAVSEENVWHYGIDRLRATGLPIWYVGCHVGGEAEKVPHELMPFVYHGAAVNVRVVRSDGCCLSRCESLACGVPQVGSLAGDAEVQISGNGVLLSQEECDDPETLRQAIESVAGASDDIWQEMSRRSRLIAAHQYHPRKVARSWAGVLGRLWT